MITPEKLRELANLAEFSDDWRKEEIIDSLREAANEIEKSKKVGSFFADLAMPRITAEINRLFQGDDPCDT